MGWSPPGRPGLRPHNRLLRLSQLLCHYRPSPVDVVSDDGGEAGLTSKPHRDRRSGASSGASLTWAVSPATGIGLPSCRATASGASRRRNHGPGRTPCTDASPSAGRRESRSRADPTGRARTAGAEPSPGRGHGRDAGHRQPDRLECPLRLAGRRAGREHVVAQHDHAARRAPGEAPQARRRAAHRPGQVGRPLARRRARPGRRPRPASAQQARTRRRRAPRRAAGARRARGRCAAVGSWPRARTTRAATGTGTSTTGARRAPRSAARTAPASSPASGPGQPEHAALLVAEHQRPERAGVLPRRPRRRPAPGASGSATPAAPPSAARPRSAGHSIRPAGRTRRSVLPSSRSSGSVEQVRSARHGARHVDAR